MRVRLAAAAVLALMLAAAALAAAAVAGDAGARRTSVVLAQQWASETDAGGGGGADAADGRSSRSKRGRRTGLLDGKVRERRLFCEEFFRSAAAAHDGDVEGGGGGDGGGGPAAPRIVYAAGEGGRECHRSGIALENCMLECLSGSCYAEVYGRDCLEEGEVDVVRGRRFRNCMRAHLRAELQRQEGGG